jgi:putative Ca2+/H+ antiporter (TMEM165/GDT1 family)
VVKVALTTFVTVFLAELGDKTQLATMMLVAEGKSPWAVFLGSASALVVSSLVGVLAGGFIGKYVPAMWVRIGAGSAFIILGVLLLMGRF